MGANVKAVKADITKKSDLQNLIEKARQLQNFQILINSAAVFEKSELKNLDFPQAGRIMNINFTSAVVLSKLFAEHIQKQKNLTGKIINISDIAGINPWSGYSFYCASKAALISAGKSLAKELAPSITVNTIAPGLIDIPEDYDQSEIERQLNFIPLKRKGERADITSTVHFLIENDYITGQVIHIDGGRTL
jgi:NAD(P)-dependent dehydrogenase (short-subunit alcohol dehydrogenase family)